MILIVGEDYNAIAAAARNNPSAFTGTPGFDSKFPGRNAYDGLPEKYVRWLKGVGDGAQRRGKFDSNLLKNPGAESGMVGWKKTGTVTSSTDQAATGTKSFKLTDGSQVYPATDIKVRSGEWYRVQAALFGAGAGLYAEVYVQDRKTGRWLQADGTWGNETFVIRRDTASFATSGLSFRAETYAETGLHRTSLRIFGRANGGTVYIDNLVLFQGINFVSDHGVGFPRRFAPLIYWSDTGAFAGEETLLFTMDPHQPSFYSYQETIVFHRWYQWRFTIDADVEGLEQPTAGEIVFGQAMEFTLPTSARGFSSRFGSGIKYGWITPGKNPPKTLALELAQPSRAVRNLSLPFRAYDGIWLDQLYEWFVKRCRAAREKVVIAIPELEPGLDADGNPHPGPRLVVHGSFDGARGYALSSPGIQDLEAIQIIEDAFPKPVKGESI